MTRGRKKPCHKRREMFFYRRFPRYQEIQSYLKKLQKKYPCTVRVEKIGHSYEGRSIEMIIIRSNRLVSKNSVMIEGGIHAREWLSHTTVLYLIDHLLHNPEMLSLMDFYIIPCINPDGYEYTHTCDRLWRKSMNPNSSENKTCWGVDLNRNFPCGYGLPGSSSNPKSFMYRGKYSLSEPETQCVDRALEKYGSRIKLYLAIHCYGNLIMYPWGFTKRRISDEEDLVACGLAAQNAMKRVYRNSRFRVGCLAKVMYISSGGSSDFARGTHKIKFSYTMELHKFGKSGFEPKPTSIINVAKETLIGIKAMVTFVHQYYTSQKGVKRKRKLRCTSRPSSIRSKRLKRSSE